MGRIGVVSYRLHLVDGVSIEARKWEDALTRLGWEIRTVAGEGPVDALVQGLGLYDDGPVDLAQLSDSLAECDVILAENILSLPLNPRATEAVASVARSRPTIVRHHDVPWQRHHLDSEYPLPDDPHWIHVTINQLTSDQLALRGIRSTRLYNRFDVEAPEGRRSWTRRLLDLPESRPVVLAPTRVIPRKNIALAAQLARASGALLWILGPAEDGFDEELQHLLDDLGPDQRHGAPPEVSIHDAYAACDAVAVTSTWEGFGNPVMEAFVHRRPLVLNEYPVARELLEFGFEVFSPHDPGALVAEFRQPDVERRERNYERVKRYFNLVDLPHELTHILEALKPLSR